MGLNNSMDKRIAPKKSLGQNFLTSAAIASRIAESLQADSSCHVLEIGPGEGALTTHLLEHVPKDQYTAVEFDPRAASVVREKFDVEVIQGDFLTFNLREWANSVRERGLHPLVIGNIPYNITSPILIKLFESCDVLERCVLMMQKEVAKRLVARPQSKEYGILSVRTAWSSRAQYCFTVAPGNFFPKPKVHSAVVSFNFRAKQTFLPDKDLVEFLRGAFSQRRKKLNNALKSYISSHGMSVNGVKELLDQQVSATFDARAEQLSPTDFVSFHKEIIATFVRNDL